MSSTGPTPPPPPPPHLLILLLLLLLLLLRLATNNPTPQHHLNKLSLPHPTPKNRWIVKKLLDARQFPPESVRLMEEATQGTSTKLIEDRSQQSAQWCFFCRFHCALLVLLSFVLCNAFVLCCACVCMHAMCGAVLLLLFVCSCSCSEPCVGWCVCWPLLWMSQYVAQYSLLWGLHVPALGCACECVCGCVFVSFVCVCFCIVV
jgi:hypothetical protein